MGRKPISADDRRDFSIRIRLSPEERAELNKAAGTVISEWAREVLLKEARRKNQKG